MARVKSLILAGEVDRDIIEEIDQLKTETTETRENVEDHLSEYAQPHLYEDEGEDPDWTGVKYRLVMINGEPFMEVVDA